MANYKLTNKAVQDLRQIWNYTVDEWSERQADAYYKALLNHCLKISQNPGIGNAYDHLVCGLRGSKINKHIVFYRLLDIGEIEIERIIHERMDVGNRILNKK